MFCPKCATQNVDGASFCRVCGANISLIPQALSGQLAQPIVDDSTSCGTFSGRRGRRQRELTLDRSFKNVFMGVAFLIIAIALSRSIGAGWWFWMLIPAFSLMATGIAQYIRLKERQQQQAAFNAPRGVASFTERGAPTPVSGAAQRNTGELMAPPPSVTEGTTRHLGVEAQTRHFDASTDSK